MLAVLHMLLGWLNVLPAVAGLVVCALFLGRSRWAGLLLGAFVAETALYGFYALATVLMGRGVLSPSQAGAVFLLAALVGFLARVAIVGGVAGVLSDLWKATGAPQA